MTYLSVVPAGCGFGFALSAAAFRSELAIVVALSTVPVGFTDMKLSARVLVRNARSPVRVATDQALSSVSSAVLSASVHWANTGVEATTDNSAATAVSRVILDPVKEGAATT